VKDPWKPFWAAQQRFFKLLCVSLKVGAVVKEAKEALAAGYAGVWRYVLCAAHAAGNTLLMCLLEMCARTGSKAVVVWGRCCSSSSSLYLTHNALTEGRVA
jgi:deoxycytidylate deaminase